MRTRRPESAAPSGLDMADPYPGLSRFAADVRRQRLENGLELAVLQSHVVPLVSTALCYRAGTRDETAREAGLAHFLEHMMFRGSEKFGPGEVDRRTLALGGHNNAYTSHDATLYHFSFASDRWLEALDMEADRMAGLLLAPEEVERERAVIVEEIGLVDDDPWEALQKEVHAAFFDGHPYGRPILGNRQSLAAIGREELAEFHRRHYRPGNAVLVVAGEVGDDDVEAAAERFAALDSGPPTASRGLCGSWKPAGLRRVVRRQGEVSRLLLALPAPAAGDPEFAPLRLLLTILGGGRASRLHRALVDEEELCLSVSTEIAEMEEPGLTEIALELVTGAEPREVEKRVSAEISRLVEGPIRAEEVSRARRMLLADWAFEVERIHQQALLHAVALALFDRDYLRRHLRQILDCDLERLNRVGRTYMDPERGGVIGWSLAQG